MNFKPHSNLVGQHAFLSASQNAWLNYDLEKLDKVFATKKATIRADQLHEFAAMAISLRIQMPDNNKALNLYINDAIGYRMSPEQVLFYSGNCFGTADAISFRNNELRVHDLKNGIKAATFQQLKVYLALYCLEYMVRPFDIVMVMRLYQGYGYKEEFGDPEEITRIMEHIKLFDRRLSELRLEN